MRHLRTAVVTALGLGLAGALATAPSAVALTPAHAQKAAPVSAATFADSGYAGKDSAASRAFFDAVMASALKKQAAHPGLASVTVTYSTSKAPSFRSQISQSTQIWNSSVSNVKLQEGSGADFEYREGNDSRGSYASTDGHGHGYVFLDYAQNQQYYSVRVVAHETGHVLGLPDHYSGPCSELMSGGGPGTSCRNAYPDSTEITKVNRLWRNGISALQDKGAMTKVR